MTFGKLVPFGSAVLKEVDKARQRGAFHLETREVLAACYLGPNKGRSMLSHSCEVGQSGIIIRVLCDRVSPLSMADECAADTQAEPSCSRCRSKKKQWLEAHG